ncbi:hypothetical protein INS90_08875 [Trueperella pecoris]|uniref:Uncharacterized protein n=1 Tax=Trueperella pecoris TaxID=2733571 RepID=A0A7M1R1P9_9ACTO|nr:hypothetical protein [Trueperella pecoris]QOR47357.1 hypothetical protein INS90_08875 [Trueperella pecoris]
MDTPHPGANSGGEVRAGGEAQAGTAHAGGEARFSDVRRAIEHSQALPFTRIPPLSRGELIAFAAIVTVYAAGATFGRNDMKGIERSLLLLAIVGLVVFFVRRVRINGSMPRMRKAPREIKMAYLKFACLYFPLAIAGFAVANFAPMPWAWASIPGTFIGMLGTVWLYERWYYRAVAKVEARLS